jgi:hypothetical protein
MSSDWINKAKEEAKKLAETAKNANYGEMFDKTRNMAASAAEEAKKAATTLMNKEAAPSTAATPEELDAMIVDKLAKVESLLQDIKAAVDLKNTKQP